MLRLGVKAATDLRRVQTTLTIARLESRVEAVQGLDRVHHCQGIPLH